MDKTQIRLMELLVSACNTLLTTMSYDHPRMNDEFCGQIEQLNDEFARFKRSVAEPINKDTNNE